MANIAQFGDAAVVEERDGYQPVGSSQRHWLWRHPDQGWQVFVVALIAAVVFGCAGYLVGRNALSAVIGAVFFGLFYGVAGAVRLRRSRS